MTAPATYSEPPAPVFLFDLDGTLIDSVYQHVIAWHAALSRLDIDLSVWRIHRRIGMSGGLFVSALIRETWPRPVLSGRCRERQSCWPP
jgi:beta-phosphoglucomutase-like phosphatase (HAD superfamily)